MTSNYLTPHNAPVGFDRVVRLEGCRLQNDVLTVNAGTAAGAHAEVIFESFAGGIWHITLLPPGTHAGPSSPMIVGSRGRLALHCAESPAGLSLPGPALSLHLAREPWCIRFQNSEGETVFGENPGDIDGLGRPFVLPLGFVMREGQSAQTSLSFHIHPDEHLFGLGEKFTPLDKKGQRIVSWTQDAFGSTSERSHKNIPFLWSSRGFGLLIDTGARITWDCGTASCQSCAITVDAPILDAWLLFAETPSEILESYAGLTGYAPVPPKWSFGLWVSSGGTYRDRPAMEQLVDGLGTHSLPADVVHVDPWWMRWRKYCDFAWDETAFPHPEEFIKRLHAESLKICLWEHPYISIESELFEAGKQKGFFARQTDGDVYVIDYGLSLAPRPDGVVRTSTPENSWNAKVAIIDLTNPDAYAWFQDLHRPALRMGVDVFKTDFGEDIPEDALFFNGETGRSMHNMYPLLYNKAVYEVTQQERGYGVVWGRSGTGGSQRYPICWSGDPAADFDSLACTIRGGLSVGMSGIPFWSNDIGGYRGMPGDELYVRWAQFGLLCSHSRMHGDSPREPWKFGSQALEIVRKFVKLRYSLFPYIYSTARDASLTGVPVVRAMPLAFPDDPNAFDKDLQYMLGPWLLVAPVFAPGGKRSVYLPAGQWTDWWTGETLTGPQSLQVSSPLDRMPMYVRAGAMIPMMEAAQRIPEGLIDPLIVAVYPSPKSIYLFEEDEGKTEFHCSEVDEELLLHWRGGPARRMDVSTHAPRCSGMLEAHIDGKAVSIDEIPWHMDGPRTLCLLPRCERGWMRLALKKQR